MPITLSESGGLGYYWYKSKSDRTFKTAAVVGASNPFGGKLDSRTYADPGANCNLAFQTFDLDPENNFADTVICQGPEWVEYVCAPPCTPDGEPICICCTGPNYVHEVRSPDVESEKMFYMLWDTENHERWCRTGGAFCPDNKSRELIITNTEIQTDADDEEIHIVGTTGNNISASALCIRYSGGTPDPNDPDSLILKEGDTLGTATIEKIYHYSKWNNLEDVNNDLNYHYVELDSPLTGLTYQDSITNSVGASVIAIAGGGIPDKCIVFGRFEFIKKKIYYTQLEVNPLLYEENEENEVIDEYQVTQRTDSTRLKASMNPTLKSHMKSLQSQWASVVPEVSDQFADFIPSLEEDVEVPQNVVRNDIPGTNQKERYLTIYDNQGEYEFNSEGNEGKIKTTRILFGSSPTKQLTGFTLTNPGAGYTEFAELDIVDDTGSGAVGFLFGSKSITSVTVDTPGVGYQLNPAPTITPNYNLWAPSTRGNLNEMYVYDGRVYHCVKDGLFDPLPPTHVTGTVANGASLLTYRGNLPVLTPEIVGTTRTEYIEMTKFGSGYTSVPSVSFNTGTQTAVATLDTPGGGRITGLTVTPGDGATSNPLITIGESWVGTEPYTIGDQVFVGDNLYTAAATGTSGTTAPTHTSGTVSDGSLNWTYAGEAAKAVSKNYDGTISTVILTDAGAGSSQSTTFNISLPTSPYVVGTQLEISIETGDYVFDTAVLTQPGKGYSENVTVSVEAESTTSVEAVITPSFSLQPVEGKVAVGDDFRVASNAAGVEFVSGTVNRIDNGNTIVCRNLSGTITAGQDMYISTKDLNVRVLDVAESAEPKSLDRIDTTLHEEMTSNQVKTYVDVQQERMVPRFEKTRVDANTERDILGPTEDLSDKLGPVAKDTASNLDVLSKGVYRNTGIDQKVEENIATQAAVDEQNEAINQDPKNKQLISVLPNEKVKKQGPVYRWRDLPASTKELKCMPVEWIPDKREQVLRKFTITCTFDDPELGCDYGPRSPFTQLPDVVTEDPGSGGDPADPGYVAPSTSTFTPPLGCGQPCCPPQPNEQMTWEYTKYFVNHFSNTSERWGNIIKTYNQHPSNANWSFL